ncbi:MAG: CGNR zinc finger domain-containing protein [Nitrospira sp.]
MGKSTFLFIGNHLALDFINTEMIVKGKRTDLLRDVGDLLAWLVEADVFTPAEVQLIQAALTHEEGAMWLQRAKILRSDLRTLAEGLATHKPIPESAIKSVNSSLSQRPGYRQVVKTKEGFEQHFHAIVDTHKGLMAPIAEAASNLLCDARPTLIKKCANDACILYFYDSSKNHTRTWCSMQLCGNRMKVAAFLERQRRHSKN